MDNPFYNIGSGLVEIEASSVSTDTLYCDDITSISGIINLNSSTLSNINKIHCHTLSNVNTYTQGNAYTYNVVSSTTTTSNLNITNGLVNFTTPAGGSPYINFIESGFNDRFGILTNFAGTGDQNKFSITSSSSGNAPTIEDAKLTILQGGNVGIGTSTPTTKLDVVGSITVSSNVHGSNLSTSNLILYRGNAILESDAKIDYKKWIKNGPSSSGDGNNWLFDFGIGIIGGIIGGGFSIFGKTLFDGFGKIGPDLLNGIKDLFNDLDGSDDNTDASDPANNVRVHWNNIIYKPLYQNNGDERVGFGSNIYVKNTSKIYGIGSSELVKIDGGRYKRIDTNLVTNKLWYDFETKTMYLDVIYSSNIYSSNIESSNALIQNISASTLSCPVIATSNIEAYNVWSYDTMYASYINSSNIASSNIYSSNLDTRVFNAINASLCNLSAYSIISSNITSSNIFASNVDTRSILTSNVSANLILTNNIETTSANVQQTLFSDNAVIKTVSGTTYIKSGEFYLSPTGLRKNIGLGTPIINVAGEYVGKISVNQIKDFSSLKIEQLMDGKCQVQSVAEPDFDFVLFNPFADIRW